MPLPESTELQEIVKDFIAATRKGAFQWKSVNPTTYVWEGQNSSGQSARLTLQKITVKQEIMNMPITSRYFLLQVSEISSQGVPLVRMSLSGDIDADVNAKLEALYELIGTGFTERGLEFLKSIRPKEGEH